MSPSVRVHSIGRRLAGGGSVSYDVMVEGQRLGWVYDERPWRGHRFGARRWSATWRLEDDRHARWTGGGFRTRQEALEALVGRATASSGTT